jgi:hypothetical protein
VPRLDGRAPAAGWLENDEVVRYRVHAGGVRTSEVAAQARVKAQTLRFVKRAQLPRLVDSCDQPRAERECPILNNIETVAAPTTSAAEQ